MMLRNSYGFFDGSGLIFMLIGMFLLSVLAVIAIVLFIRSLTGHHGHGSVHRENLDKGSPDRGMPSSNALNILNERFVKGEITEEEYNKIKDVIKKT
ncbi:MAG: SHOCT domain-containing protein [Eubacteriaceae bacterium]|nr:SHOCT domain-containing protein [Eubacteriaceae bacterium]